MNRKSVPSTSVARLRRRAEARLRRPRSHRRSEAGGPKSAADAQRLLHELQVHQIEMELQNAELQEARDRMGALLDKYTDLYDFAPVGYFSVDEPGRILEVNLTGAALLGVERTRLVGRPLRGYVASPSRPVFVAFLERVFAEAGEHVCEAALLKGDGTAFWANVHGTSAISVSSPQRWCRVAVSDMTALKQAEEVQSRIKVLAAANRGLREEVVRRQAVEEALRQSEQHQRQMLEESRSMQQQLRHLSHRLLQAEEEERKRISRELHDEIAQTLVGISVHLETLAREARVNPERLKKQIARTQTLVEKSVNRVHQFARGLRPMALDDLGLIPAIHTFMKDFTKRTGVRVHFTTFAGVEQLSSARRTVLYRVVHSALTNVAQHAQASRVNVSIRKLPGAVRMEISDNGKSFEVERVLHAKRNKHLGLLGMRERLEMVGGNLSVESAPGQGTTIRAEIPFGGRSPWEER